MNGTKIEWVKNPGGSPGYSWNPITGCLKKCPYCYAWKLANTRLRKRYLANENVSWLEPMACLHRLDDPFYPRFWPERLKELDHDFTSPRGVFVCDMSDLFGIGIPEMWTRQVMDAIRFCPQHRFYLLTKQPQNLIKFSPFPDNCWVGVSATDKLSYQRALKYLGNIGATQHFISFEPLLSWDECLPKADGEIMLDHMIDWVIIGAQTKPTIMPKIEWVREIVEACDKAGVKVFLKDSLEGLLPPEVPTFYSLKLKAWHDDGEPEYDPILRQQMPGQINIGELK